MDGNCDVDKFSVYTNIFDYSDWIKKSMISEYKDGELKSAAIESRMFGRNLTVQNQEPIETTSLLITPRTEGMSFILF